MRVFLNVLQSNVSVYHVSAFFFFLRLHSNEQKLTMAVISLTCRSYLKTAKSMQMFPTLPLRKISSREVVCVVRPKHGQTTWARKRRSLPSCRRNEKPSGEELTHVVFDSCLHKSLRCPRVVIRLHLRVSLCSSCAKLSFPIQQFFDFVVVALDYLFEHAAPGSC